MQRKLSLGIAVCGGSTYIILDEPSSGVDPKARKDLWVILEKYRENRTLLISTHYMDEAEALGDRIVIISNGKLECDGTVPFLKAKLGKGYHLSLNLKNPSKVSEITKILQNFSSEVILEKWYGNESQYLLPFKISGKILENIFD
jgi:ATP-binding cassette subfamily A (ABC1) protein 3